MKALSLTQPWAWLVVHGGKTIENRVWNTHYRGDFLIHAAKGMRQSDYDAALSFVRTIVGDHDLARRIPPPIDLHRGGIIGRVRLVDVIPPCVSDDSSQCACGRKWHMGKQYGFVLENITEEPFRPLKGLQRFFESENPNRQVRG